MENLYEQLAELLEVDNVKSEEILSEFECWDSLTQLSIIALASENYNVIITASEIKDACTIGGLEKLIISKQ